MHCIFVSSVLRCSCIRVVMAAYEISLFLNYILCFRGVHNMYFRTALAVWLIFYCAMRIDGPLYAFVSWIVIMTIFLNWILWEFFWTSYVNCKVSTIRISLLLFRGLLFLIFISTTLCVWENCITVNSNLSRKDDKMMQLRLYTLNRHHSKCVMDIILKACSISKALEICHWWLASY